MARRLWRQSKMPPNRSGDRHVSNRRPSWRGLLAALFLAAGGLLAGVGAFAVGYAEIHRDTIVPGVSVGGVALGGLGRTAAEAKLRVQLPDVRAGKLLLVVGAHEFAIPYSEFGRDYDFTAMLDDAFAVARIGDTPEQLIEHLRTVVERIDIAPVITWNRELLDQRARSLAASVAAVPRDAALVRDGVRFTVGASSEGTAVDSDAAVAAANAALSNAGAADTTVAVATSVVAAAVSSDIAQAAADRLNSISGRPLAVVAASRVFVATPRELALWLTAEADGPGVWIPRLDERAIWLFVDRIKADTDIPARDGTYEFVDGKPVAVQAQNGLSLDADAAVVRIRDILLSRAAGATTNSVTLPTTVVVPAVSTSAAHALVTRVTRLSSWTTKYEPSPMNGFGVNIRRPTDLIDGTVVEPGGQFDFVAIAGPITAENGYTDGAGIINGSTKLDGVTGGGLCSASTTLFNAALRAGFQIDERRAHAYYINRYPVGLDATIWVNGTNVLTVAFTNDSQYPLLVRGINRDGSVTYEIYGVPDGRKVRFSEPVVTDEREAWTELEYTDDLPPGEMQRVEFAFDGFDSVVTRTVSAADGATIHYDTFRSSYRRVIGLILIGREPEDPPAGTRVRMS